FQPQPAVTIVAPPKFLRDGYLLFGFLFPSLLAIQEAKLIWNPGISRVRLGGFLQPLFGGGQIALLEVSEPEIIRGVTKRRLFRSLIQISDRAFVFAVGKIQSSQVVQYVRMISHLAAHG